MSVDFVEAAATLVRRRTGLVFSEARRPALEGSLARAVQRYRVGGPAEYLADLDAEPSLLDDLLSDITVGETYFFREPRQFELIRHRILPDLLEQRADRQPVRCWSAGCATGEEPYTLAILAHERADRRVEIIGTDVCRTALASARRAVYTRWSLRGVPEPLIDTWFRRSGGRYALAPSLRERVAFHYLNLADAADTSPAAGLWNLDLILCRNVLIYFDATTVARVAGRLLESLSEEGWLLLGASDPPLADLVRCEVVVTECGLAYRRPRPAAMRLPACLTPATSSPGPLPARPGMNDRGTCPAPQRRTAEPTGDDELARARRAYAALDYQEVVEVVRRLTAQGGGDTSAWILLVRALANLGDLSAAELACASGLERHRTSAELTCLHAVLLGAAGHPADALEAARRAVYLDRDLLVAQLTLADSLASLDRVTRADRVLRHAISRLATMPSDAVVPAADGVTAGRLLELARSKAQGWAKGLRP